MAFKLIDQNYCPYRKDYVCDYICDTEADVETLPAACVGSSALVIESGSIYFVNTSGQWSAFGGK